MSRLSSLAAAVLAPLLFAGALATPADAKARDDETRRVLFVGNSLTATNDLPLMVKALAAAGDGERLHVATVALPNASLDDHWQEGTARRRIRRGRWDVVVLQQGPSSLPASRRQLIAATSRFAELIRRHGAEPALLMTWPDASRLAVFDDVSRSHAAAAREASALLLPCGDAWRAAWDEEAALPLFGDDGFHPSRLGTFLTALVVHARLSPAGPVQPPRVLRTKGGRRLVEVSAERAALLRRAVRRVTEDP